MNQNIDKISEMQDGGEGLPPYSLVWTPIPCCTPCMQCIGHYGITDSKGYMYDFDGSYHINVDQSENIFGTPTKYLTLNQLTSEQTDNWDEAILQAKKEFEQQIYNFCCNNCHDYCARVLNILKVDGKTNWKCSTLLCSTRCKLKKLYYRKE